MLLLDTACSLHHRPISTLTKRHQWVTRVTCTQCVQSVHAFPATSLHGRTDINAWTFSQMRSLAACTQRSVVENKAALDRLKSQKSALLTPQLCHRRDLVQCRRERGCSPCLNLECCSRQSWDDGLDRTLQAFQVCKCLVARSRHFVHYTFVLPHQRDHVKRSGSSSKLHTSIHKFPNVELSTAVKVQRFKYIHCIPDFQTEVREDSRAVRNQVSLELVKGDDAVVVCIQFVEKFTQTVRVLLPLILLEPHHDVTIHLGHLHSIVNKNTRNDVEQSKEHDRDVQQEEETMLKADVQEDPLRVPPADTTRYRHEEGQDGHRQRVEELFEVLDVALDDGVSGADIIQDVGRRALEEDGAEHDHGEHNERQGPDQG